MKRIGPKITELEPFISRRLKFLKISLSYRMAIFNVFVEVLTFAVLSQFFTGPKIKNPKAVKYTLPCKKGWPRGGAE